MTMDRTLKHHGGLIRMRSVLTRTERITRLTEEGKFDPDKNSPMGLPKVRVRQSRAGTKSKKVEEPKEAAAPAPSEAEAKAPAKAAAKAAAKGKEKG